MCSFVLCRVCFAFVFAFVIVVFAVVVVEFLVDAVVGGVVAEVGGVAVVVVVVSCVWFSVSVLSHVVVCVRRNCLLFVGCVGVFCVHICICFGQNGTRAMMRMARWPKATRTMNTRRR